MSGWLIFNLYVTAMQQTLLTALEYAQSKYTLNKLTINNPGDFLLVIKHSENQVHAEMKFQIDGFTVTHYMILCILMT